MDVLYSQLYDKYKRLKDDKDAAIDAFSRDQEAKFLDYVSAAEDVIQNLKREIETLRRQKEELSSANRDAKSQFSKLQQLLVEERGKSKSLFEEVEKHQKLSTVESQHEAKESLSGGADEQNGLKPLTRQFGIQTDDNEEFDQPNLHAYKSLTSDIGEPIINGTNHENCLFQTLLQSLVGLDFNLTDQADDTVSVIHQSSGFTFILKIDNSPDKDEGELFYQVISLGTFERVAPEWMRDDMIFRLNMCPIFFERLLKVMKRCC